MEFYKYERENLLTIGEAAKSIGVTRRMILNYEARGLVQPDVKEGTSGNRYYTTDTLTRIRMIRTFQDLGLSLDEIHNYFDGETDLQPLIFRLEKMRDELNLSIEKLRARLETDEPRISVVELQEQSVYIRTMRAETVDERKAHLRVFIPDAMRRYGSDTSRRMFFIIYPLDDPAQISYCISVPDGSEGEYIEHLARTAALCVTWHGGYDELPAVRERMIAWSRERGIVLDGTCRHVYLEGPAHHKEPSKFITQVMLPFTDWRSGTR